MAWNNMASLWEGVDAAYSHITFIIHTIWSTTVAINITAQNILARAKIQNTAESLLTPILSIIRHSSSFTPSATVHFSTCIYWQQ